MIGWPRRKLLRQLLRMNAERGGSLLLKTGRGSWTRYTTTLDALKSAAPQWFRDDETLEARLEDLEESVAHDTALTRAQTVRVAELSARIDKLEVTNKLLVRNLKNVIGSAA